MSEVVERWLTFAREDVRMAELALEDGTRLLCFGISGPM